MPMLQWRALTTTTTTDMDLGMASGGGQALRMRPARKEHLYHEFQPTEYLQTRPGQPFYATRQMDED